MIVIVKSHKPVRITISAINHNYMTHTKKNNLQDSFGNI